MEDVPFEPGSADLTPHARSIVEGYAELLARRPKRTLEVCGRATAADLESDRAPREAPQKPQLDAGAAAPALRDLAVERTRVVRRFLIERAGLSVDRVTTCPPEVDPESSATPRVVVSL